MSSLKAQILAELEWRGALPPAARADLEAALAADEGNPLRFLLARGIEPEDVLQAAAAAAGLTPAPRRLLAAPQPASLSLAAASAVGGVPVGERQGTPLVAFDDPDRALEAAATLPPHQALLCLPEDLARARAAGFPDEDDAFESKATVALPQGGATFADGPTVPPSTDQAAGFDDDRTIVRPFSLPEEEAAPAEEAGFGEGAELEEDHAEPTVVADISQLSREHAAREAGQRPRAKEPSADELLFDDEGSVPDAPTVSATPLQATDERDSPSLSTSWLPGNPALAAAARADDKERKAPRGRSPGAAAAEGPGVFAGAEAPALEEGPVLDTGALHVDTSVSSPSSAQTGFSSEQTDGWVSEVDTIRSEPVPPPQAAPRGPSRPAASLADADSRSDGPVTIQSELPSSSANDEPTPAPRSFGEGPSVPEGGVGRYRVRDVIGRGGMAAVHIADDPETGREVALKILEPHLAEDAVFVERFRREVASTKSLQHENIIRLFDAGETGDKYFMVMEYVDGGTLSELLRRTGPMPIQLAVPLLDMALAGLDYAHEHGTVHRDLKPANLMLTKQGVLKIGDFGIAKTSTDETLTKTGTLFGTPAYMSPEQAMGQSLDNRSDLFSIGIVFYQLLTGTNPFHSENPSTSLFKIAHGRFPPLFSVVPWVPDTLDQVLSRLLKIKRDERFPTGQAARMALAPLKAEIEKRWPSLVARSLERPRETVAALKQDMARAQVEHAMAHLAFSPPRSEEAAFRLYLATRQDEHNFEAVNGLAELRLEHGYRFEPEIDERIAELHQALREHKPTPALLRRAHDLHAAQKDLFGMARYGKQYLGLQPHDEHMRLKLLTLVGGDPLAPFSKPPDKPPSFAPSTSKEAAEDIVPGLRPAGEIRGPGSSGPTRPPGGVRPPVRGSVGVTGAAAAGIRDPDGFDEEAVSVVPTGPDAPLPEDEAAAEAADEGPKDSVDELLVFLKAAKDEVIRSFTGDQGVEGLREWWTDRFNKENKEEIKQRTQQLLGQSRQALEASRQKILDEQNREKVRGEALTLWQKHRRMILLVGALLGLMWLLKLGCGVLVGGALEGSDFLPSMGSASGATAPEAE